MIDGIIKGNGNSRYLKTVSDALTKYPTYQDFLAALISGTLPIDLNGINSDGWTQVGTALNKANLLTDATAALFGLGSDAVPDDVFGVLSRFQNGLGNEYVWEKTKVSSVYEESLESVSEINVSRDSGAAGYYQTATFGRSISINQSTGEITITNTFTPTTEPKNTNQSYWDSLGVYYVKYANGTIYKTNGVYVSGGTQGLNYGGYKVTSKKITDVTHFGYVNSYNPGAYPVDDGYTYIARGRLGNKAQFAFGTYTGTDTKGSSGKCSLTFDFVPKVLIITTNIANPDASSKNYYNVIFTRGGTKTVRIDTDASTSEVIYDMSTETVTWYASSASYQMNVSTYTYAYIAFG